MALHFTEQTVNDKQCKQLISVQKKSQLKKKYESFRTNQIYKPDADCDNTKTMIRQRMLHKCFMTFFPIVSKLKAMKMLSSTRQ